MRRPGDRCWPPMPPPGQPRKEQPHGHDHHHRRHRDLLQLPGQRVLYLTTNGRKSGKARTTPLLYFDDGGRWLVVASNGGAEWEPGWWLNLQAGSAATVEVDGVRAPVTGAEITGSERETLWRRMNQQVFD